MNVQIRNATYHPTIALSPIQRTFAPKPKSIKHITRRYSDCVLVSANKTHPHSLTNTEKTIRIEISRGTPFDHKEYSFITIHLFEFPRSHKQGCFSVALLLPLSWMEIWLHQNNSRLNVKCEMLISIIFEILYFLPLEIQLNCLHSCCKVEHCVVG